MPASKSLHRVVARLERFGTLDEADRRAILALPYTVRDVDIGTYLVREGERPPGVAMMLSGFAYRHKITGEGARQILAVHLPGEFVDLQNAFLGVADHNVQALSRGRVAQVSRSAIHALSDSYPNVARAMWTLTLVDASVFREWVVNVGRRSSIARIAHLLCEFAARLEAEGLADEYGYELPMTQEQLADACGLTPVHVNRVLKELGRMGLIDRQKRAIAIRDWAGLRQVGDFNARYLHLAGPPRPLTLA
ncbi:MAG TPA: Crp/Fnr family transcriptional regulator [Allosphingosinicella sp.]